MTDDEVTELQRRFEALTVAARAMVEAHIVADLLGRDTYDYCLECERTLSHGHDADCTLGRLAVLLEGVAGE